MVSDPGNDWDQKLNRGFTLLWSEISGVLLMSPVRYGPGSGLYHVLDPALQAMGKSFDLRRNDVSGQIECGGSLIQESGIRRSHDFALS